MNEANAQLAPSQACVDLVKASEGCKLTAYKDAVGVLTIGYGSTKGVHRGMTITQQEADDRLYADMDDAWQEAYALVDVPLTQGMVDGLTSFTFNLGAGNLKKSTLLKKLNAGDADGAADEFAKWSHAGSQVLQGLVKRREAERELFLT